MKTEQELRAIVENLKQWAHGPGQGAVQAAIEALNEQIGVVASQPASKAAESTVHGKINTTKTMRSNG